MARVLGTNETRGCDAFFNKTATDVTTLFRVNGTASCVPATERMRRPT